MYGIPLDERQGKWSKMFTAKRNFVEGTDYMGKCLLSLNLIPNDKPEKGTSYLSGYNEPEPQLYNLLFYFYEMELFNVKHECWCTVKFGGSKPIQSEKILPTRKKDPDDDSDFKLYKWKDRNILVEGEFNSLRNLKQAPDIVVSLYTAKGMGGYGKRIGYARIPADSPAIQSDIPEWLRFKDTYDNSKDSCPGSLLFNARLVKTIPGKKPQKLAIRRSAKYPYIFICSVWGCVELAPGSLSSEIKAKVEIDFASAKTIRYTSENNTRNPIFYPYKSMQAYRDCDISDNLKFVQRIQVTVRNCNSTKFFGWGDDVIGKCSISPGIKTGPCKNMGELKWKPEVFT